MGAAKIHVELELVPLRHPVSIPRTSLAFDEGDALRDAWHAVAAERLLDELAWCAGALRAARAREAVAS